jgi:hypothetical protein
MIIDVQFCRSWYNFSVGRFQVEIKYYDNINVLLCWDLLTIELFDDVSFLSIKFQPFLDVTNIAFHNTNLIICGYNKDDMDKIVVERIYKNIPIEIINTIKSVLLYRVC